MRKTAFPRVLQRAGVPKRYLSVLPDDVDPQLLSPTDRSIFVTGPPGTGKTYFMCAYLLAVKSEKATRSCLFISVDDLLRQCRSEIRSSTEVDLMEDRCSTVDVLFLDDFGVSKVSEWVLQILDSIISRRYNDLLQTVISSNKSLDEMTSISTRIASRIVETYQIISMSKKDWRTG